MDDGAECSADSKNFLTPKMIRRLYIRTDMLEAFVVQTLAMCLCHVGQPGRDRSNLVGRMWQGDGGPTP